MTDLYTNLLKATSNIDDITTEKYGVITKLDGLYCSVKETDNELEHNNVPIVNGANLSVGDKVIIGFLNNSIYDVVCYGALDKTIHDDTKQDKLISGENIKTINHTSLLGSGNIDIQGGGSDVDIVTSWEPTPSDTKVPSEKLTKNTLDTKVDKVTGKGLSTNDFTNSYKNTIDGLSTVATTGDYDDLTDKPTIPSASTTTPSADTTSGSYGSGTTYARSNHTHPKSSLYAEATHSHTKSQITDFPTIPTNTSDLTNDGADGTNVFVANNDSRLTDARTPSSHSHGNITNDGKIGTNANYFVYTTTGGAVTSKQKIGNINYLGRIGSTANLPLITTTNGTIATGSFGSSANTFCEGNDSRLSDARTPTSHTHTKSEITDFPTIPSKTSDLTNDSGFITSSSLPTKTSDLTNDGDGTNPFLTQHQSLANYVQKSSTSGLLKNDGTVDTTQYLSSLPAHNHDDRYYTESEVDTALGGKQATLISGTNIKTINNTSLLGSGNITIGGGGSSVDIATSWGNPTSDSKVPSEKLTKSSLDSKIDKSQTVGLVKNDGTIDTTSYSTFSGSYNDLTNKPSIPSKTSDLTNDSNFISKSSTNGLMKNDGTIDTTTYVNTNDSRLSDARTPLTHTHTSSQVTDLIDVIYPVGSIYMSVNSTSPQTLFGGTWEQIKDTFLLASGDTYANGTTGGSADAIVVSHNHTTDRAYVLTTDGSGVSRISTAGQTGTKVSNLLQSADAIYRNEINSKGTSGVGKNMPPYLTVFVWKRTA